ncbi:MAG: ribulose-phosphate 3-epimerase [Proteobacteria bacterium]|nr:ribulose-phosphate 3-epimerase [Pseudomonadota bacterium]
MIQSNNHIKISASILSANFAKLGEEIEKAVSAGADWIHFDVMDHHFVPNLSFGSVICQSLRQAGITAPIDVHLMVDNPEDYIEPFAKAGANLLTFHPETAKDIPKCLKHIHAHGMQSGMAVNPDKSLCMVEDYIKEIDLLLLMSVYPGFGGQSFIEASLEKVKAARQLISTSGSKAMLGIDGGIKLENIDQVVSAGADFCIIGSGLFHAKNYQDCMQKIREKIKKLAK